MIRITFILFGFCLAFSAECKDIRVGLFGSTTQTKADVFYKVGRYEFMSETKVFTIISNRKDKISFVANGEKVNAYLNGTKVGENKWFRLNKQSEQNSLEVSNGIKKKEVKGNLVVYSIKGKLQIVNEISIDNYVEGVIKGEAGYGYSLEYYKVQAVISRTYALHHQKHKDEGFELCDHTHCQVYDGVNTKPEIKEAVLATSEEVLVDSSMNFINTLFHSNCGGQTVTTDMVWSKKLSCMESVQDTFCIHSSQANWEKTISKSSWIAYLSSTTKKPVSYFAKVNLDFNQTERKEFYTAGLTEVRLTEIRKKFNLKSTFFSVHVVGDKVVFIGRGYGHGAGLCQEGGIVMVQTYTYQEVLHHYYKDVSIMPLSKVQFYKLF